MRHGHRPPLGIIALCAGATIIMALILPAKFWWFILGASLIGAGIWICRCC